MRPSVEKHTEMKLTKFGVQPKAAQAAATTRAAPRFTQRMYAGTPAPGFCAAASALR